MDKMSFHSDYRLTLLLKPIHINSKTDLFLACLVITATTVLYEGLRCLRVNIMQNHRAQGGKTTMLSKVHIIQTALYLTEFFLAYILMLSVMTYNAWLLLAVLIGAFIGFQLCTIFSQSHLFNTPSRDANITKYSHNTDMKQSQMHDKEIISLETQLWSQEKVQQIGGKKVKESGDSFSGKQEEITQLMTSI